MKEVVFTLQESGDKKLSRDEVLKLFDQEIDEFSHFMAQLSDFRAAGPLINEEKAMLKTYLVHKFRQRLNGEPDGKTEGGADSVRPVQAGPAPADSGR